MSESIHQLAWLVVVLAAGCTSTVNPSFRLTKDEAKREIRAMRADPKPLPRPLVVIGGFLDLNVSPPLYAHFFSTVTRDTTIIPISLGLCGSFDECRQRIISAVDKACPAGDPQWTAEVDVVGASLGGLAARYAAAPSRDPVQPRRLKIARLFTISSPHSGATLANAAGFTSYHRDFRPGSEFLTHLAQSDATASYELVPYVHLHDEIVGEHYAAPPGVVPLWLPDSGLLPPHAAAMLDVRIHADIARRLRCEAPLTTSPPTPLPAE